MTPAPSAPAPSTSTAALSAADSDTDLSKASPEELFERVHQLIKSIVGVCTGTGSNKLNKAEVNAISGYLDTGRTC